MSEEYDGVAEIVKVAFVLSLTKPLYVVKCAVGLLPTVILDIVGLILAGMLHEIVFVALPIEVEPLYVYKVNRILTVVPVVLLFAKARAGV